MTCALLGGSFDPVHAGHVAMARHVLACGLADHVVVVPNARSPWRSEPRASGEDRLAMCRLAFAAEPGVEVDGREVAAGRAAWTVQTLEALAAERAGERWRLVIGADHLATFGAWHRASRILELAELLVLARAGSPVDEGAVLAAGLPPARVLFAPPFDHPVSATGVRAMLGVGGDVAGALPAAVADYIAARGLYRDA